MLPRTHVPSGIFRGRWAHSVAPAIICQYRAYGVQHVNQGCITDANFRATLQLSDSNSPGFGPLAPT